MTCRKGRHDDFIERQANASIPPASSAELRFGNTTCGRFASHWPQDPLTPQPDCTGAAKTGDDIVKHHHYAKSRIPTTMVKNPGSRSMVLKAVNTPDQ